MKLTKKYTSLLEAIEKNSDSRLRTVQALDWYRKKILEYFGSKNIDARTIYGSNRTKKRFIPGDIVTFRYKPKLKDVLPYYDTYPLVLILKIIPGGFIGLNFHYIDPRSRAYFMDVLYDYLKYYAQSKELKINITYDKLANTPRLSYYRPCIKRYLNSNIGNMFYILSPDEWNIALFLPTESFVKETKEEVWGESKKIIGK
ncbi:DNA end protector protein [uncultured Caudovirales phage]|uniref:DNA end protector protein n=1 Tax=uncultured Caudovirales phage TaxID=2100421 RepID=A0A6J5MC05_9CAUD|nr:DNA end protector protein [uncultured Caudovirales phage]